MTYRRPLALQGWREQATSCKTSLSRHLTGSRGIFRSLDEIETEIRGQCQRVPHFVDMYFYLVAKSILGRSNYMKVIMRNLRQSRNRTQYRLQQVLERPTSSLNTGVTSFHHIGRRLAREGTIDEAVSLVMLLFSSC